MESWEEKRFKEATQSSLDDMGDIGNFEPPAIRDEEAMDCWIHLSMLAQGLLNDPAPNGIVASDAGDSVSTKIKRLITQYGRNWKKIDLALRDKYDQIYESIEDDLGDVSNFENPGKPPANITQDIYLTARETFHPLSVAVHHVLKELDITLDDLIASFQKLNNPSEPFNGAIQMEIDDLNALKNGTYVNTDELQESIEDDLGDMGDFEEPPSVFSVLVHIPDDATTNRDVWKFDGKVVQIRRLSSGRYYDTEAHSIPAAWCTQVLEEAADLGDVGDFEELKGNPIEGFCRYCGCLIGVKDHDRIQPHRIPSEEEKRTLPILDTPCVTCQPGVAAQDYEEENIPFYFREAGDLGDVGDFEEPKGTPIIKSCGVCGSPLGPNGEDIYPVPSDYNPDDYEHDYCKSCGNDYYNNREPEPMRVSREMAMDAGDPDLEGQLW